MEQHTEQSDSEQAFARADLRWLLAIAERERLDLLKNQSRAEASQLGQAMTRARKVFLGDRP